jgi:hypothetical protein
MVFELSCLCVLLFSSNKSRSLIDLVRYCTAVRYGTVPCSTVLYCTVLPYSSAVQYRTVPYSTTYVQYMNVVPFRNWRAEVVPKSIDFPGLY